MENTSQNTEVYTPGLSIINHVFTILQSVKGTQGFLNRENIQRTVTETEKLIVTIKAQNRKPTESELSVILQACDFIKQIISHFEKGLDTNEFDKLTDIVVSDMENRIINNDV